MPNSDNTSETFAVTLVIIPGSGATSVNLNTGATLATLVSDQNLHGRSMFINGAGVEPNAYTDQPLQAGDEVFATGSVKGN